MWKIILIECILLIYTVLGNHLQPFIFGGEKVTENTYSFMVLIEYHVNKTHTVVCSGSLVSEKWVLTAAHCFENPVILEKVVVTAGGPEILYNKTISVSDLQIKKRPKQIYIHNGFEFEAKTIADNDIALIELDVPFVLNENVSIVDYSREESGSAMFCTVLGFGFTENRSTGSLYHLPNMVILPPDKCQSAHPHHRLNGHFVCFINNTKGICSGDSGGPLFCNGKIYGISTASVEILEKEKCISVRRSYFLIVSPFRQWIECTMNPKPVYKKDKWITILKVVLYLLALVVLSVLISYCVIKIIFPKLRNKIPGQFYKRIELQALEMD